MILIHFLTFCEINPSLEIFLGVLFEMSPAHVHGQGKNKENPENILAHERYLTWNVMKTKKTQWEMLRVE